MPSVPEQGVPKAVLTKCQQSHEFEERQIPLSTGRISKIGRAVVKFRPQPDNAIFDCKVLSRSHAELWFENGKFYLRDTKSSNGTFVNQNRLSKGSEESPPREIFSGDMIQFGVDIVESTKQVTHGCIIAIVRLFQADGTEHKGEQQQPPIENGVVSSAMDERMVSLPGESQKELQQLHQYLQEATHREHQLEIKMAMLKDLIGSANHAAEVSWQALIDEDRLLSRIQHQEEQIDALSKNNDGEKLREELLEAQAERHRLENSAKETLRRVMEEKTEVIQKLNDVERSLETTEEENGRLKEQCQQNDNQIRDVTKSSQLLKEKIFETQNDMKRMEEEYREKDARLKENQTSLEQQLIEKTSQWTLLIGKLEALESERKEFLCEIISARNNQDDDNDSTKAVCNNLPSDEIEIDINHELRQLLEEYRTLQKKNESVLSLPSTADNSDHGNWKTQLKRDIDKALAHLKDEVVLNLTSDEPVNEKDASKIDTPFKKFEVDISSVVESIDIERGEALENSQVLAPPTKFQDVSTSPAKFQDVEEKNLEIEQKRKLLEIELEKYKELAKEYENTNLQNQIEREKTEKHLSESHHLLEHNKKECLQLRGELDTERSEKQELAEKLKKAEEGLMTLSTATLTDFDGQTKDNLVRQLKSNEIEFAQMRDNCSKMKEKILEAENRMKKMTDENVSLNSENKKLKSEADKSEMEKMESRQVHEATNSAVTEQLMSEIENLRSKLEDTGYFDYERLSANCRSVTICSVLPLIILFFGIIIAFYPFFSWFTATSDE